MSVDENSLDHPIRQHSNSSPSHSHHPIRCAILGYGPTFEFGRAHAQWIAAVPDLELAAVCDRDPERAAKAKSDYPDVETFHDLDVMLKRPDINLVSVVTPHNTHAELVIKCLRRGKHVIVDKPMCTTAAEATAMIEQAKESGRMLAVFHNRRHDGNYRTICELVRGGVIGDIFHIELSEGGYGHPGQGWRSDRALSGSALFDWGAHVLDWLLHLVPGRVENVTGLFHKLVWKDVSNVDQARAIIRFRSGVIADLSISYIAAAGKPLWRILGTGRARSLTPATMPSPDHPQYLPSAQSSGHLTLVTMRNGRRCEQDVPYTPSNWKQFYVDVANHLLRGGPVPVSGEDGRRVIAVLNAAERSDRSHATEPVEFD